jgi:PTS system nitrogen regulatory IIA component
VKLIDWLSPSAVMADLKATSRDQTLAELVAALPPEPGLSASGVEAVLREREDQSSTAVQEGVAIPHGRLPGLKRMVISFGRSRAGIPFAAPDHQPTRLFFLLLVPSDSTGGHLKALARIARLSRDRALREQLLAAPDAAALFQTLAAADQELAGKGAP